jgi:hypothetical protein
MDDVKQKILTDAGHLPITRRAITKHEIRTTSVLLGKNCVREVNLIDSIRSVWVPPPLIVARRGHTPEAIGEHL